MKQKFTYFIATLLLLSINTLQAQQAVKPMSYNVEHSDSCWYVTMNYRIDKMPKNDELLLISQICCPDTCINDSARRFQGKRYAKRYIKQYGRTPDVMPTGDNSFTMVIPEDMVTDTLIGVTYSEYTTPDGTIGALDTVEIILPVPAALSCRPVRRLQSTGDRMAQSHPFINNIRYYTTLNGDSAHIPTNPVNHVHFALNSQHLDPTYLNNAAAIDSLVSAIISLTNSSDSQIESIHIVGYTSPDSRDETVPKLGYKRAGTLCNHLQQRCNLPDSIFEVADGGKHWHMIYSDLTHQDMEHSDSLVRLLQAEKNSKKRLALLRRFNSGRQYSALCNDSASSNYRGACCTRIYYHNLTDSSAHDLNNIVNELANNPHPDYDKLRHKLSAYSNDPRALNIKGVIEHRQHRRSAAAEAFRRAAELGDEQAAQNMDLLGLSMD